MKTKETIAIIGATGTTGSSIARKLSAQDYSLILTSKEKGKLRSLKNSLSSGKTNVSLDLEDCAKDVCWEADIIIMVVAYDAAKEVAEKIREVATGKVVINIADDDDPSDSVDRTGDLQKLLPDSKVMRVLATVANVTSASTIPTDADPFPSETQGNVPEQVRELLASAGLAPILG